MGSYCLMGTGVYVCNDEKLLHMEADDGLHNSMNVCNVTELYI